MAVASQQHRPVPMELGKQAIKEKSSRLVNLKELEVESTELGWVTSIHEDTRTFFLQLCKNSNQDLINMNKTINELCNKAYQERQNGKATSGLPAKIRHGDILCARFTQDQSWYRALVLKTNKMFNSCSILFIDYGNIDHDYLQSELVEIAPRDLAQIERPPFGFSCFVLNSETFSQKKIRHLLNKVMNNYVMVKTVNRQSMVQWTVELPENGYNSGFLVLFKAAFDEDRDQVESKRHKPAEVGGLDQGSQESGQGKMVVDCEEQAHGSGGAGQSSGPARAS